MLDRVAAVEELDSARIARAIGFTRFPYASPTDDKEDEQEIDEEGSLLRAADLIGELGDPHYLRKANALYYEFEEIGLNKRLGYESPADKYPLPRRVNLRGAATGSQMGVRHGAMNPVSFFRLFLLRSRLRRRSALTSQRSLAMNTCMTKFRPPISSHSQLSDRWRRARCSRAG